MDFIFPRLKEYQFAVLVADSNTGQVFEVAGDISKRAGDELFKIFDSLEDAYEFIGLVKKDKKNVEFCIYDCNQKLVKFITMH